MRNTPAKTEVKMRGESYNIERKMTPNFKKINHLEGKNILSAPKKKNSHPRVVARSHSDKSQPKIDSMYKQVPLKRPSFEFDDQRSTGKQ